MSFTQFLLILRARIWTILVTFVLVTAAAVAISLLLPKKYTATAAVVVDARPLDPIAGIVLPMLGGSFMATQIDILTSERVAMRVVKTLKLDQNEIARQEFLEDTGGAGSLEAWLAQLLLKNLDIKPSRDSTVIDIAYTAVDPRFAAVVANAFAQSFIETNLEMKVEPARQYAVWFDERSKALREKLERAQRRLSEYQQKSGIISVEERLDVENARLQELSTQVVGLQSMSADSRSRQRQAGSQPVESLPEVLVHPLIQNLKADISRAEGKLKDLSAQYGRNHPLIERSEAELAAFREKLDLEIKKVVSGIATANHVNTQREAEIRAQLEAQRAKVIALKKEREEVTVLQQEVENAQKAYDVITTRYTQSNLESQSNQTNIYLLNQAVEPYTHSRPRILLNTIVGVVLGLMLGIGLACMYELRDRRVRSVEDLAFTLELPMLAAISSDIGPRIKRRPLLPAPRSSTETG